MKSILAACLAFLAFVLPATAASESGSHGWARTELTLFSLPSGPREVTGIIAEDSAIKILQCRVHDCLVDGPGGRGWTSLSSISFGQTPDGRLFAIQPNYPANGTGEICFFTGRNFTGASLCAGSGQVFTDLAAYGRDNAFRSVAITGTVSAAVCSHAGLHGACERIIESQEHLAPLLSGSVSSIRVY